MKLFLLEKNRLIKTELPTLIEGNYWITDESKRNLLNVEARDNKWFIKSNRDVKLILNDNDDNIENTLTNSFAELELISNKMFYCIDNLSEVIYKIYCDASYDLSFKQYQISRETLTEIIIGNNEKTSLTTSLVNNINCSLDSFAKNQIQIKFDEDNILITNLNTRINMYINGVNFETKKLINGEQVFIDGIKICVIGEILLINHPDLIRLDTTKFSLRELPLMGDYDFSDKQEEFIEYFKKEDYFQRPPRINRTIELKEIKIDSVPANQKGEQMPLIFTMGTMLTMGATSMLTGLTAITKIIQGESTAKEQLPSLITCGTMIVGMMVFPLVRNFYIRHKKNKKEKLRQKRYKEYLLEKKEEIQNEINYQQQVLLENNLSPEDCAKVILNKERNLWERKLEHVDFLNVRVGLGTLKPQIIIKAPEEHFVIEKDNLEEEMYDTVDSLRNMENVPIVIDLKQRLCSSLIGKFERTSNIINNILLQLITSQSYDILKIVVFTDVKRANFWNKYKNLPYLWNNEKTLRFFATNQDEIMRISSYLTEIYNNRVEFLGGDISKSDIKAFKPYYLIITDTIESLENVGIISTVLNNKSNLGFSIFINTDNIDSLPNECSLFVNIDEGNCAIYEQELVANKQLSFVPDNSVVDLEKCLERICNIPIDIADGKFILPQSYSFLEMYDVGNVNQLNSINRWKENNIISSLQAPVGINEQGELFKLDIHEKAHGPHGLVAGMTGSGKSEWLITYILSMAINYHPDEVQFVIIDYKGGGLALVFENRENGFKLPHLAGTITNLDAVEINRALASIQSELKRRQTMFNAARDSLNESTIDIYKYQRLYREGKVREPISHLIIISDEFAELKAQQPEFMKELISTARIGRSLGVHLILATQKPSGVVDDQIWSNAKFRACLKVQEKADSNDMIKRPDAAMIKEPGRFFLQVGYNEYFAKGQAAYAGGPYYESDKRKIIVDTSIDFLNNLGECYKTIESKRNIVEAVHKGEELPNILNYIKETAEKVDTHVRQLWLERIPNIIFHDKLKEKYNFQKEDFDLNPIIGEYDAPEIQKQGLLTLPLTKEGNAIIYGMSGSGKENLLCEILYSLISTYTVNEVNAYILDFGAEVLMAYRNAPHVGDIIRSGDDEKINNLFKLLRKTLEERKTLFQEYNGDIKTYSTTSGKMVPNMIIIINNIENFQELYPNYSDELTQLTRDGAKYGILFIVTTNGVNNIRLKLSQNFPEQITLQLKDKFDYVTVLGNIEGTLPSKIKGRGLVKLNKVYEFQSAYIIEESNQITFIKDFCQKLKETTNQRATRIPLLPDKVNLDFIDDAITDIVNIPIGVYKESLNIAYYNFWDKGINLIASQDSDMILQFINSFLRLMANYSNLNVFVIDAIQLVSKLPDKIKVFNSNFDELVKELDKFISSVDINHLEKYNNTLFVFIGLNDFISQLLPENKKLLQEIISSIVKINKFNAILADSVINIKKLEFELWYKECVNTSRGIWLGSGIDNQFTLKLSKVTRELREELPENFGYVVENGKAYLTKFIDIKEGEKLEQ